MRGSVLISLFGVSMALTGALVACGGDEEKAASAPTGAEGESCTRRADCNSGLKCFDNVCLKSAGSSTGGSGNEGGGGSGGKGGGTTGGSGGKGGGTTGGTGGTGGGTTGGTGGTGPAPDLGGEGESCTRSADCETGLGCFNNRCTAEPTGEGGGGNVPGPSLGRQGETCVLSSDCETGLVCIPQDTGGLGSSVGVCSPSDTGIVPTGKSCFAECASPADCCELPTELHGTLGAKSCTELAALIQTAGGCVTPDSVSSPLCFAMDTYCDCASGTTTWQCTAGQCIYNGACATDGLVVDGCATFSRSGRALTATCDATGTERCRVPAGDAFCDTDADCKGKMVTDDNTDLCIENECACYQHASCLRKCVEDLDCAYGKVCGDDDVCIPAGTCTSNVTCQLQMGDYRATCVQGACTMPCDQDIDCNMGLTGGALSMVCDGGSCKPIGCTDDSECQNATDVANMVASPRKMFCATVAAGAAGVVGSSAITD